MNFVWISLALSDRVVKVWPVMVPSSDCQIKWNVAFLSKTDSHSPYWLRTPFPSSYKAHGHNHVEAKAVW